VNAWVWCTLGFLLGAILAGTWAWQWVRSRHATHSSREPSESEDHFKTLYESSPVAVQSLDDQARILEVNSAWLNLLGRTREEVVGKPISDFLDPSQVPLLRQRFPVFLETGRVQGMEFVLRRRTGEKVTVSVEGRVLRDAKGAFRRTLCVLHNISERKAAEQLLKASEERYRLLTEQAAEAVFLARGERLVYVNPAFVRLVGAKAPEDVIGRTAYDFFAPEFHEPIRERMARLRQGHPAPLIEEGIRALDGRIVNVEVSAASYEDHDGWLIQVVLRDITRRKELEAAARTNRALLNSIINGTDEAIFAKDLSGRYLLFNRTAGRMVNKRPEEVIGCDDTQVFPPEEAGPIMMQDRRILETELPETRNWTVTFADGEEHVMDVRKAPLRDESGQIVGVFGVSRDITESARMTAALRQSEARLATAQRIAHLGSWETSLDETGQSVPNTLWWSEEVYRIFGYDSRTVKASNALFFESVPPEDRPRIAAAVRNAIETRSTYELDHRATMADGSERILHEQAEVVCDDNGKPVKLRGTVQDITERKQAEAALAEKEQFISAVATNTPDYILVFDLVQRRPVYFNRNLAEVLGYSREEAERLSDDLASALMHPEDQRAFAAHVGRLAGSPTNAVSVFEYRMRRTDGSYAWFQTRDVVFQRDPSGLPVRLLSVTQDITEAKTAAETRVQLEAQLRQAQKMEAVGHLAGGVAHDFNNILSAMLMNLDFLRQEAQTDTLRSGLAEMEALSRRAAALTRQLLLFGRRQVMQRRILDLNSLLSDLLNMLSRLIGEHITLRLEGFKGSLWVEADPGMIEQVVMNLVVNARDAMPQGGQITLRLLRCTIDAAHVTRHPEARLGPFVSLSVQDTGCGMDEHTLARIFEPFFTTKDVGKGTGLGLSTVYGIIQQHQGWIEVTSQPGEGATFHVFLPAKAMPASEAPAVPEVPAQGGSEAILLVEDEPAVRQFMVLTLKRLGYRVIEASHGQEALKHWVQHSREVDLLLTDVVMPEGLGGFELADCLRKQKPDLRVVLMSGYSAEMMSHGFSVPEGMAFLQKPFTPEGLAHAMRDVLDRASAGASRGELVGQHLGEQPATAMPHDGAASH
jgi:PAS domain S-box-containing protein